jgi:hypothetical protein
VFAKFSTTHTSRPASSRPSGVPATRPSTSICLLAPVAGSMVNSAPSAVWIEHRRG